MSAAVAGVRPDTDPRLCHLDGPITAARLAGLDPAGLAAAGHNALLIDEPVPLGLDDELDVRFFWLLREAISTELRVDWAASTVPFDPVLVCHLQPPRSGVEQWRHRFRFGRCYYRKGPGFVLLKDTRDDVSGARYRLDDPAAVAALVELEGVVHTPDASPGALELAGVLDEERLVLRRGSWLTLLPFRIRRWPVPFDAV